MTQLQENKKIYFLSDFHLGAPDYQRSLIREKKIVRFFEAIKSDAQEIFIVGDMFDFWYEYKKVVPKYFVRILGKLAELSDNGIVIHFFVGNHDMWMNGYFEKELSIRTYHEPKTFNFAGKSFFIGHGDGLGPKDKGYKFLKKIFRNPICNWLFGQLHPSWGLGLANYFSRKSKEKTGQASEVWLGEENEWLYLYSKQLLEEKHVDYFIFGHRHLPIDTNITKNSRYINLGEWITSFTYAVFDGKDLELKTWRED